MPETRRQQKDSDPNGDRRSADIGIVCTHSGEIKPFIKRLDRRRKYVDRGITYRGGFLLETVRIAVVEAGPGFANHREATQTLIQEHHPAWVIAAGFSSSLSPSLAAGDLSLATEICDVHGNQRIVKCPIPESRRVRHGRHVAADQHPATTSQKEQLAQQTEAIAVDTTSLAVVQVCQEAQTRVLSVRAIIDEPSEAIPSEAFEMIFRRDSKAMGGLLGGLVRNLKRAPVLNQWRLRSDNATLHLDKFLSSLVAQLAEHLGIRT